MSLNRCEQRVFDYLDRHVDERQHWQQKLRAVVKSTGSDQVAVVRLEPELWRYYQERSAFVAIFKEAVKHEGEQRTSMKNLAELLIRLWTEPRPKPKSSDQSSG